MNYDDQQEYQNMYEKKKNCIENEQIHMYIKCKVGTIIDCFFNRSLSLYKHKY
jgi:hypothetical protein